MRPSALFAALLLLACSSPNLITAPIDVPADSTACVEGNSQACACDGGEGYQRCRAGAWSDCFCAVPTPDAPAAEDRPVADAVGRDASADASADAAADAALACPAGYADCDGARSNGCEADLSDWRHCGSCAYHCPVYAHASSRCESAACYVGRCDDNFGDCDAVPGNGCETDLRRDNTNCGGCGRICRAPLECNGGVCSRP